MGTKTSSDRWPWRPTREQEAELTRMGFTVGENAAWVNVDGGRRAGFIWYPSSVPASTAGTPTPGRYGVDLTSRSKDMVYFDDPITAAVWLLTEISNGTPG